MILEPTTKASIQRGASTASQLAALCHYLSEALGANPETSAASEAIDGLRALAIGLSNDLHAIAEPSA